ncbi:retropepsin-like aspartic protease family protein [Roseobacter sinensis]|uniref:TIGR02281 family clan AA aspartic protease n=1 Tax=Roseobacter sinensis TaxID=2931391 RepID=A0ABT3BED5_9RHOB|nr:TIGR02281 family clan AA aspartic protease [Roseobacter sp. WL0113]MCV3271930.1 TIGR02281 family clan AA aspartic protease [Roseobacter sp. WL0113]
MDGYDTGRLIYLIVLGLMVCTWFFAQNRLSTNKLLQQGAIWGLIFLGVIAAYGLWDDISQTVRPQQAVFSEQGQVVVPRSPDGHYYISAEVNGTPVQFVLDTGATMLVLTRADALAAGLDPDTLTYTGRAMTANGEVRTAPVRLDTLTLGPATDTDIPAVVNSGEMAQSLMGMTYLQRWGRIEIAGGELTLTR